MDLKEIAGQFVDERIQDLLENRMDSTKNTGMQWIDRMDSVLGQLSDTARASAEQLISQLMEEAAEEGRFLYVSGLQDGARIARVLLV